MIISPLAYAIHVAFERARWPQPIREYSWLSSVGGA